MGSVCDRCFLYGRMKEKDECVCYGLSELLPCRAHTSVGGKKDSWEMGDGVCEVAKEEEWGDGVLVGERAGGDECVLTV